jgi:hypothetical protein
MVPGRLRPLGRGGRRWLLFSDQVADCGKCRRGGDHVAAQGRTGALLVEEELKIPDAPGTCRSQHAQRHQGDPDADRT